MNFRAFPLLSTVAILLLLVGGEAISMDIKERLFADATAARNDANELDAVNLAPDTYARAARAYRSAEKKFSEARALDSVQRDLDKAIKGFEQAQMIAELAQQRLGTMLKARVDAKQVDADQYSARDWKRAETYYRDAIAQLEDGRGSTAMRQAESATRIFRDAELTAIKTIYLAETGMLIAQAEKQSARRYAPETLAKAKNLLARAEVELTENRYDTDLPRSLAREAKYEARHAIYLANYLKEAKMKSRTPESMILEWEQPLQQVAAAADMNAEFHEGFAGPTQAVIEYIEDQRADSRELGQVVADRDAEIFTLNDEISRLTEELGGAASEQAFLQQRLAAQEELRQKVKEIEGTFERSEAEVFRDSNEIYIRLVGLSFASGSADIDAANFQLLTKVQDAIRVFDDSAVIIEGHTDSHGADESNLTLSEQRAESVRQYLMVQMNLSDERVNAVGYGETRPVANNETPQGRAKNRRIDVRIVPNPENLTDLAAATFQP